MNKKQIVGLIAAAVTFVVVGTISTLLHVALKNSFSLTDRIEGMGSDGYGEYLEEDYEYELPAEEFIGLVEVRGNIEQGSDYYYYDYYGYGSYYDHEWTLGYIDRLIENSDNKGLLLYVDSSGGGVYESDELYLKLMEYKEETDRPIWTYMASQACSGGYYIAMASDKIYCNRNGLTGSIGVVMTLEDYTVFMERMGISEINITSGANKAMGAETEKLTAEQRDIFQSIVDETYEQFVDVVAYGRNMTREEVKKVGDGRVYTPKQALELNLIDEIAAYDEMVADFEMETGVETVASAGRGMYAGRNGQGEGKRMDAGREEDDLDGVKWYQDMKRWQKVGRPMYYAE